ncbi:metallophosphoesterase family protein [Alteromonas sp. ASW11-130]|uniref:metallophosphoesterase family protein n=1 Tax=Alteromonas sp. ASW11-130 TaxID=3015775 RepID=UPI0022425DFC|nr:metallophosphoesterase [Alteromonas sp. ASW11-130]MCW8090545.1 metallophosphoesterase [Alteromonas sp. ASW11-130]
MRLIQLSDCHLFADKHAVGYASVNPYESLKQVLKLSASLRPDLVVVTGDISGDNSEQSYRHFLALVQAHLSTTEVSLVPGNHDNNEFFINVVGEYLLHSAFPIEIGGWEVHGFDTRYKTTLGKVKDVQLEQVKANVLRSPDKHHMVALHHHPVAANSWMDTHALYNREGLIDFVKKAAQVKLLIHGHVHFPLKRTIDKKPVLGVPSTCWQWKMTKEFNVSTEKPGLRIIDLHNDGSWTTQIRRL